MNQIKIVDKSCIGAARRLGMIFADEIKLTEPEAAKLAIIINELASNLVKHAANKGEIVIQIVTVNNKCGIEIIAIDKGPGIHNLKQSLSDGYSTQGTAGNGLGAVMRLADCMNIYSQPGQGTIVIAQLFSKSYLMQPKAIDAIAMGGICLPKLGEKACGDAWASYHTFEKTLILVADGLGHGLEAAVASELACQVFNENKKLSITEIITQIDCALRKTRGAAVAITEINYHKKYAKFVGLGNISGAIIAEKNIRRLMSRDGTAGAGQCTAQEFIYPWQSDAILIMHSDGLSTRWNLDTYPGIFVRHPTVIASILYRDFNRNCDDITVLAAREQTAISNKCMQ